MKLNAKRLGVVLAIMSISMLANATALNSYLIQTDGDPSVAAGKFYGYNTKTLGPGNDALEKAKALATDKHVPLVVIWSEEDCPHCNSLITEMNGQAGVVSDFLSTNNAVFAFFKADTDNDDVPTVAYTPKVVYDAYVFARSCGAQPAFPLFAFYYTTADGTVVKAGTPAGESSRTWAGFKSLYLGFLADNGINPNYRGGVFAATGTEYDRYEAESRTTTITVDIVRSEENALFAATNAFVASWPDGTSVTNWIEWSAGNTNATASVDMTAGGFSAGFEVLLHLYDEHGALGATNLIAMVERENSTTNPLWLDERTSETLQFGEWTSDIDAATNMAAAAEGEAYTLVSLQGSLWCPDCVNTDSNFLDLTDESGENRFRKWAASNHVALAVVDIPNYGTRSGTETETCASPSMFSKRAFTSRGTTKSGLPYLSRKMVSDEDAAAMRARNHFLASTNTDKGGFHRPEDTNLYRTGVPIYVLLRKDGSVASRLIRFATKSPGESEQANWDKYIARFDEMIAGASDAEEVANNHWSTTSGAVCDRLAVTSSVSHVDTADWFEITDAQPGSTVRLALSGASANVVSLSVAVLADGSLTTVASEKVAVNGGTILLAELSSGEKWYAGVSCANTDDGFTVDSAESTVAEYVLDVAVAEPSKYPGDVEFVADNMRVIEPYGTGIVQVARLNGGYGAVSVRVTCTPDDETSAGRIVWTDQVVTWQDGEKGVKEIGFAVVTNDVYEGEGKFMLAFADAENVYVGNVATCSVTVIDTDAPCFERVAYDVSTYATFDTEESFALLNIGDGDTQVKISYADGSDSLPSGLKLAYDRSTGAILLSGVPKKPGTYNLLCTVSARRNGKRVAGFETSISITVDDPKEVNPMLAVKRDSQKIPLVVEIDGTNFVAGTLTFAATSKGALSAKYAGTEGRVLSFSGRWSGFDEDGNAVASLSSKGATLDALMDADGRVSLDLALPAGYSAFSGSFQAEADWPQTGVFDAYRGYYTVAFPRVDCDAEGVLPSGSAFLTLKMSSSSAVRNGTVRYAGILPDGTSVSGSTTLGELADGFALLPVFSRSSQNVFGALLEIGENGSEKWCSEVAERELVYCPDGAVAYVLHRDSSREYSTVHEAYGVYYLPGVSPLALDEFYAEYSVGEAHGPAGSPFCLSFDASGVAGSERYGTFAAVGDGEVSAGTRTFSLARQSGLSFSFNSGTGVFRGTAKVTFESGRKTTASYRGVLVPGWVLPCECGLTNPERPFGCGTLYFSDIVGGKSARRSIPVIMDK